MILKIIGSSSAGNSYILQANNGQSLILDCGINNKTIQKQLNWNIIDCAGCLITHEHGDHIGPKGSFVQQMLKTCVPVYASVGTIKAIKDMDVRGFWEPKPIERMKVYHMKDFKVMAFGVNHDATEPFAYLIDHPESGRILFATDTAFMVKTTDEFGKEKWTFDPPVIPGLTNIMIECNYDENVLERNFENQLITPDQYWRVKKNHMSLMKCAAFLKANDLTNVVNIVLLHLSPRNANPDEMAKVIEAETHHMGKVTVALPGKEIKFNNTPF
jgi:phosphoribosyl 1,2-cyclic phosphodiesterase